MFNKNRTVDFILSMLILDRKGNVVVFSKLVDEVD